jgi:indole-3-glycerol phosphate synthase
VLTEPQFFQGDLEHLRAAREISGKPCIRKDFIIDQYQIAQARLYGADCILMIAAILTDWQIRNFKHTAREYGMDALLEIHNEEEARRASPTAATSSASTTATSKRSTSISQQPNACVRLLPQNATVVAESGVSTREDAQRLRAAGADALLVGETLMKANDVGQAITELLKVQ